MFSEVDLRSEIPSEQGIATEFVGYRSTRFLVQFFTIIVFCSCLLTFYFWVHPEIAPDFLSFESPRRSNNLEERMNRQKSFRSKITPLQQERFDQANMLEIKRNVMGIVTVTLGAMHFVIFLKLMARFYDNTNILCDKNLETSRGLFLCSWFIPLANLYFPFQTLQSILIQNSPRKSTESSSNRLLVVYWLTLFAGYMLFAIGSYYGFMRADVAVRNGGGIPPILRQIDVGYSFVSAFLMCLIIFRIDSFQRFRAKHPRYDQQIECVYCGEPVSLSQGQCPMCGRKIPLGTSPVE